MPQTFYVSDPNTLDMDLCVVTKNGEERHAHVLERRPREVYVHYVNTDKRLDEWVSESAVRPAGGHEEGTTNNSIPAGAGNRKRKRGSMEREVLGSRAGSELSGGVRAQEGESSSAAGGHGAGEGGEGQGSSTVAITEEEYDIEHHKQITAKRNFDKVNFGRWQIKTWYFSPYPLTETEIEEQVSTPSAHGPPSNARIPGVARSTLRSHGRTSDLLAGGLGRSHGAGEKSMLWVCDKCFKYMSEGLSWELHVKKCTFKHPPGRKVYQRGAHIIWEVDGAKDKLYCQNLSLFGKLFIDIKTLFFDCDNFLFYILTDADSQRDHVLGFFSKEKLSYDDYNLACIVVLPPYQKKGYGMLLIEFSYELSRRAGKVGTPERPLSDLGLRSYLTYWISTIVRFLRRLLSVLPADTQKVITTGSSLENSEVFTPSSPSRDEESGPAPKMKRRKSTKGWDGEDPAARFTDTLEETDTLFTNMRTIETTANPDGSSTSHVVVHCTLADLARATGLRVEDAAFALNECGLLIRRAKPKLSQTLIGSSSSSSFASHASHAAVGVAADEPSHGGAGQGRAVDETIVVSREMVEAVAKERNVKKMCMDLAHVML